MVHPATRKGLMSLPRWTSSSSANRADELVRQGYAVLSRTVLRTLHKLGYSLQAKAKVTERSPAPRPGYDLAYHDGRVSVGDVADTAEFAVEAIRKWWAQMGRDRSSHATRRLTAADAGGSSG